MANDKIIEITNAENLAEVVQGDKPVLVDFWASWCGPCRAVAPVLDELANERSGEVQIAKVNVDDNQELAAKYQVSSIPTFLLFKNGELQDRMMGAMPKRSFEEFLSKNA